MYTPSGVSRCMGACGHCLTPGSFVCPLTILYYLIESPGLRGPSISLVINQKRRRVAALQKAPDCEGLWPTIAGLLKISAGLGQFRQTGIRLFPSLKKVAVGGGGICGCARFSLGSGQAYQGPGAVGLSQKGGFELLPRFGRSPGLQQNLAE